MTSVIQNNSHVTHLCQTASATTTLKAVKKQNTFDTDCLIEAYKRLHTFQNKPLTKTAQKSKDLWNKVVTLLIEKNAPVTDETLSWATITDKELYKKMHTKLCVPTELSLTKLCATRTYKEVLSAIKEKKPFDADTLTKALERLNQARVACAPYGPAFRGPDITPTVRFLKWEKIVRCLLEKNAPISPQAKQYANKIRRGLPEIIEEKQASLLKRIFSFLKTSFMTP